MIVYIIRSAQEGGRIGGVYSNQATAQQDADAWTGNIGGAWYVESYTVEEQPPVA